MPEPAKEPISTANPPLTRRISTVFCTGTTQQIRGFSAAFPQNMHTDFIRIMAIPFPQCFRSESEGISGLGRKEKWRKAGGGDGLRKSASFVAGRSAFGMRRSPIAQRAVHSACFHCCTFAVARGTLTRAEVRQLLVANLGLTRPLASVRAVLDRLRCIQLDPLDAIGTNADLVVMARTNGIRRGDVWRRLFPRHAFEHFAKER